MFQKQMLQMINNVPKQPDFPLSLTTPVCNAVVCMFVSLHLCINLWIKSMLYFIHKFYRICVVILISVIQFALYYVLCYIEN